MYLGNSLITETRRKAPVFRRGEYVNYYPGAEVFTLKLIFSLPDGKILGAQAIGKNGIDKCIDTVASVLNFGGTVNDLIDLEMSYAPPFGAAKSPINMAGYYAENILNGIAAPILPSELAKEKENGGLIIDLRSPALYAKNHIADSINIPTAKLRNNIDRIDKEHTVILVCKTGLNGYFMERMLRQRGFKSKTFNGRLCLFVNLL